MANLFVSQLALYPSMGKAYILSFLIHCYKYDQQEKQWKSERKGEEFRLYFMSADFLFGAPFYFLPKMPQKPLPLPDDFSARAANDSSGYLTKLAAKSK